MLFELLMTLLNPFMYYRHIIHPNNILSDLACVSVNEFSTASKETTVVVNYRNKTGDM